MMQEPACARRGASPVKRKYHDWTVTEKNMLAQAARGYRRDHEDADDVAWQKVLDEGYFTPEYADGEQPLTARNLKIQYARMGGADYVITWAKKKKDHVWWAPTPRYAPGPRKPPPRPAFQPTPRQAQSDARRSKEDARRRAEPRPTSYLGTPIQKPSQGIVTWAEVPSGVPTFGSKEWRAHVKSGPARAMARGKEQLAAAWREARALAAELRREIARDEELHRIRRAWNLPQHIPSLDRVAKAMGREEERSVQPSWLDEESRHL